MTAVPLVAFVGSVPLLAEALTEALESIAEVRRFPAGRGDTDGLLRSLRPNAVVVDTDAEAEAAMGFARAHEAPLVHVSLGDRTLRVLSNGGWAEAAADGGATVEAIRNVLVAGLFGRREVGS